jgi:glycosyltransferase involved in cell wall biosynthesis
MLPDHAQNHCPSVSVVIATLGGGTLAETISTLNRSTFRPAEILVCIPVAEATKLLDPNCENVKVIVTPCRGQVAQRVFGFRNAKYEFVMQLDDDMLVAPDCIERLISTVNVAPRKVAASPALLDGDSGRSLYQRPKRNELLSAIYYRLMNGSAGYQPGCILKSGVAIGVDYQHATDRLVEVDWLPGGCVMHKRANLILENYYPFAGKAHGEDIIHSLYLRQQGCTLVIDTLAKCRTRAPVLTQSFGEGARCAGQVLRVQKYYMSKVSRQSFSVYLSYAVNVSRALIGAAAYRKNKLFGRQ